MSNVVDLKAARTRTPAPSKVGDSLFDFDMSNVLRVMDESGAANGSSSDPVVLGGESERAMRAMLGEFCLPRLPLTIAELHTVVEYCQMLDTAAGFSMLRGQAEALEAWQAVSVSKYCGFHPQHAEAIKLYAAGKKDELRALHLREKTIEKLAVAYGEFDNEPADDEA